MSDNNENPGLRLVTGDNILPFIPTRASPTSLVGVLGHLKTNDELFDYNVPKNWRNPSKEGLEEFLIKTYSPANFEITDPNAVKQYLRKYDFVEYNGKNPSFGYKFYLKPGMEGTVTEVNPNNKLPISALWEACEEVPKKKELMHSGRNMYLHLNKRKVEITKEILPKIIPGMIVEPAEVRFKYSYFVPIGARGIVTEIDESQELPISIIFGNTEGYIPSKGGPTLMGNYASLKLIRENNLDIKEIIRHFS